MVPMVQAESSGVSRGAWAAVVALSVACGLGAGIVLDAAAQGASAAPPVTSSQESLPSPDEILAKYRDAIGGERAIRQHRSRHLTGRFEMPAQGMSGPLELLAAAPDSMRLRVELQGIGEIQRGYDGTVGWSIDPAVGPRLLAGRELDEMKHSADFYYDARRPGGGLTMAVVERTTFEGCDCYAMRVVRPSGFELMEYYDASSGLLAGVRMNTSSPMGTVPAVTVLSEYKKFGRLLMPTMLHQKAMGIETVLQITDVTFDQVPPDAFALPPAIQALVQ